MSNNNNVWATVSYKTSALLIQDSMSIHCVPSPSHIVAALPSGIYHLSRVVIPYQVRNTTNVIKVERERRQMELDPPSHTTQPPPPSLTWANGGARLVTGESCSDHRRLYQPPWSKPCSYELSLPCCLRYKQHLQLIFLIVSLCMMKSCGLCDK